MFSNSVFSQNEDSIRVVDVKSFMEPFQNKNPDTTIYMFSQYPAVFHGGVDSLKLFIKKYLFKHSIGVVKNKTMILSWVIIEKDGCVSEVQVLPHNNSNPVLDNGIKMHSTHLQYGHQATQDGKKLRFKIILPFNFP